jgi:hypothetical protein
MNLLLSKAGLGITKERTRMKKYVKLIPTFQLVIVSQFLITILFSSARASPVDGSWIYVRSIDLADNKVARAGKKTWFVQSLHKRVMMSSNCILNLQSAPYVSSEVFSNAMKSEKKYLSIKNSIKENSGISRARRLWRKYWQPSRAGGKNGGNYRYFQIFYIYPQ